MILILLKLMIFIFLGFCCFMILNNCLFYRIWLMILTIFLYFVMILILLKLIILIFLGFWLFYDFELLFVLPNMTYYNFKYFCNFNYTCILSWEYVVFLAVPIWSFKEQKFSSFIIGYWIFLQNKILCHHSMLNFYRYIRSNKCFNIGYRYLKMLHMFNF